MADGIEDALVRRYLAEAMRLAGVAVAGDALAASLPLAQALLADWPLLTRAAAPDLEPMPAPRRRRGQEPSS